MNQVFSEIAISYTLISDDVTRPMTMRLTTVRLLTPVLTPFL